ncbi:MAG: MBL fold metallo-hydrolase [Oscillospiraceae bacterium]|nr:MBL fold metallo-hydrolase [Oscillospiraceae bacterium]
MLFKQLVIGTMANNCYIIADEETREAAIFDAPFYGAPICDFLTENNLNLKYIILTHGHFDHITAVHDILAKFPNAKIVAHTSSDILFADTAKNLTDRYCRKPFTLSADIKVEDGDIIKLGNIEIKVIHTPGHTCDSLCFLVEDKLISGDTLFRFEVGRADFPTSSFEQEISSIVDKLYALPPETRVYPGHGEPTTIGDEIKGNPYTRGKA